MKNFHTKLKNHGKKVIIHLKRHHRKYLFGALCSGILALVGIHTASTINSTFADEEENPCSIQYSTTWPTNQDVVAYLTWCSEGISAEESEYTFTGNWTHTFDFKDSNGDIGNIIATVDWIDKAAPNCLAEYRAIDLDNVIAYITWCDEEIFQIDEDIPLTYLFHHRWTHEFWFSDEAWNLWKRSMNLSGVFGTTLDTTMANISSLSSVIENNIATISWETTDSWWLDIYFWDEVEWAFQHLQWVELDEKKAIFPVSRAWDVILKLVPNNNASGSLVYTLHESVPWNWYTLIPVEIPNCSIGYDTESPTNSGVIAYLTWCNWEVYWSELEHSFNENWSHTFLYKNWMNNYRYSYSNVTWIDKTHPTCDIAYSSTWQTNQDVVAYLTWCSEEIIAEETGYTFTENWTHTFEFEDLAGNSWEAIATVDRIDKVAPTCDIEYSTTWRTNQDVLAYLTWCSEEITTEETGYTFAENWTHTFEFQDLAGNTWEATATVDRIDKVKPTCDVSYSTTWATTWNVVATLTGCSKEITWTDTQHTFTWNWTYTFNFQDLLGNTGSTDAIVTWIISWDNTTYFDTEWNKFIWNDLTICNPNTSRECITMMDRNLWATTNDISKTWSYWYHYQWWNNHGFSIWSGCRSTMSQCSDEVTYDAVIGQTNADGFWPDMPYSSGVFYKWHIDWTSGINYNLRWWSGDSANNNYWYDIINKVATNMIWRQWPCPEWYHIPSMWERFKLLEYWKLDNNITGFNNYSLYSSIVVRKFQEDFKIPFAGVRYYENAKTWAVWQKAYLWSSSPSYVDNMIHIQSSSISFWVHSGAYGESIRCFKNSSNTWNTFSISFDNDINPWEYTTFTVRAMKDWISYSNYTGTVIFTLSNKDWGLINKKNYTFSNSWRYTFEASDLWRKTFYSWLKINEEWTYVLEVNWLNDGFKWSTTINVWKSHNSAEFKYDTLKFNPNFSDEMNEAYQYARYFDITTKDSIKEADMYSGLNRIAMAKMLANYAENVLWEDNFDTDRDCTFKDVSTSLDKQYDYWVTKACQLWIMWVNMPNNKFYPNWWVTRKEFATALSRLLYWTKDGTINYYSTHITKLKREWIITNTDPDLWELRWYVMLMLKRVAENSD